MGWGKNKNDGNELIDKNGTCRICKGRGGHWATNNAGKRRAVPCPGCNQPPKG